MAPLAEYAKPPFGGPEQVLKYLARYTHRVAISNHRLIKLEAGRVTFRRSGFADPARTSSAAPPGGLRSVTRRGGRRRRWT